MFLHWPLKPFDGTPALDPSQAAGDAIHREVRLHDASDKRAAGKAMPEGPLEPL